MGITLSNAQYLNVAINIVLPIVVAVVTARVAPSALKAVVLLALSALSGFLVAWLDALTSGVAFLWGPALFTILSGFATAVLAHFGLLKPVGVTGSAGGIQTSLPGGLGGGRHARD